MAFNLHTRHACQGTIKLILEAQCLFISKNGWRYIVCTSPHWPLFLWHHLSFHSVLQPGDFQKFQNYHADFFNPTAEPGVKQTITVERQALFDIADDNFILNLGFKFKAFMQAV